MITFANNNTRIEVRSMWKACFGDSDAFLDLFFERIYKDENTLLYNIQDKPIAAVQLLPYNINFYNNEIPFSYISGACTLPEHRKKGYMEQLLIESFLLMKERDIPLSILIPAEDWLYGFYEKYGYTQCFEGSNTVIPIKQMLDEAQGDVDKAYNKFKSIYSNKNLCVQKSRFDFETILLENEIDNYATKTNLSAMARVIDAQRLLEVYAAFYPNKELSIKVIDALLSFNNNTFTIKKGECIISDHSPNIIVDINLLAQLLFGFKTSKLEVQFSSQFEEQEPTINLMLE